MIEVNEQLAYIKHFRCVESFQAVSRFYQNVRFDKNLYNLQCCAKDFSTALFLFIERSRKCGYNKDRK